MTEKKVSLKHAFALVLNNGDLCEVIGMKKSNRSQLIKSFNEKPCTIQYDTMRKWLTKAGYRMEEYWYEDTTQELRQKAKEMRKEKKS